MNVADLGKGFELMLFGMAGVFLVLLILYGVSQLLLKLFPVKKSGADKR
jgi:Na+-transporting methylmalonyl-CoA/oxaloacetate decarboxylase gamma subunit